MKRAKVQIVDDEVILSTGTEIVLSMKLDVFNKLNENIMGHDSYEKVDHIPLKGKMIYNVNSIKDLVSFEKIGGLQ
jgi:hypothetical protein